MPDSDRNPPPEWAVPAADAADVATRFIAGTVETAGAAGLVIGLSGGIDSAVSAALAVRALGPERVLGVCLPYASSSPDSLADAREVAAALAIESETVQITPLVDAWAADQPAADALRRGNVMARCRMVVLYDLSARDGKLVLGTGNRSEELLGYTTLHGDNACALNPLGLLYKTEVRLLAEYLDLPAAVRTKPPSADLWAGQADEDELGFSYAEADRLLHHLVDECLGPQQLVSLGFDADLVRRVDERVRATAFKRCPVPVAFFADRPAPATDRP